MLSLSMASMLLRVREAFSHMTTAKPMVTSSTAGTRNFAFIPILFMGGSGAVCRYGYFDWIST